MFKLVFEMNFLTVPIFGSCSSDAMGLNKKYESGIVIKELDYDLNIFIMNTASCAQLTMKSHKF